MHCIETSWNAEWACGTQLWAEPKDAAEDLSDQKFNFWVVRRQNVDRKHFPTQPKENFNAWLENEVEAMENHSKQ